jgi:hydroxyquinol 1,2-dioxygenase
MSVTAVEGQDVISLTNRGRDLDEFTVTEAALREMATTRDPRRNELGAAALHLHALARGVNLTPAEWPMGIGFLTEIGQPCSAIYAKFIVLSGVLGVSAVVNALHNKNPRELGRESSLLGPFHREGAPELSLSGCFARNPAAPVITSDGQANNNDGKPISNTPIQV